MNCYRIPAQNRCPGNKRIRARARTDDKTSLVRNQCGKLGDGVGGTAVGHNTSDEHLGHREP